MAPELAMLKLQKKKTDTMTAAQAIIFKKIVSFFLLKLQQKKPDTMSARQATIFILLFRFYFCAQVAEKENRQNVCRAGNNLQP